jgi:hypothetical protein
VPLTNLLKNSAITYEWEEACDEAFDTLKGILVKAPVLKLPNFDKEFEIHSDAFDFAIGGVLVQEGRPVAFESKKLSETERRWPTHEKEMWVVIHCLKTWGVDRQCDLEVLFHSTQVVIKTSKVARHIVFVQSGHLAQARK